jgi:hypothetical protein
MKPYEVWGKKYPVQSTLYSLKIVKKALQEESKFWATFFRGKKYALILTKMGLKLAP